MPRAEDLLIDQALRQPQQQQGQSTINIQGPDGTKSMPADVAIFLQLLRINEQLTQLVGLVSALVAETPPLPSEPTDVVGSEG